MELLSEKNVFYHGIIVDGKIFREFVLEEEVMRHTFMVSNDQSLNTARLSGDEKAKPPVPPDEAYYSACLVAARLKVAGIPKVSPEQVEMLSKADGQLLLALSAQLAARRDLFREEAEAAAQGHPSVQKVGVLDGGSPGDEPSDN